MVTASDRLNGRSIAVIGAGMAGLAAAQGLAAHGATVTIVDKGRGIGGRVATKIAGELAFDHGAQFATSRGIDFAAFIGQAGARGQAAAWTPRHRRADADGVLRHEIVTETRHVGVTGMNALAVGLAGDLAIRSSQRVVDLHRAGGRWTLDIEGGETIGGFDTVILAIPAPQAVPLVTGINDFATTLAAATYAPCWAVMAAFPTPVALDADAIAIDDAVLAWAARDSSKPGRAPGTDRWVLHAAPDWSRTHIEEDVDTIAAALLDRFIALFGPVPIPGHLAAHRWRYALVENAAGIPCLWDAALGLGACGDWCIGPRVEAAFDSGTAMAKAIAAS